MQQDNGNNGARLESPLTTYSSPSSVYDSGGGAGEKWREATELFWDNVDVQGSDHFVPFDVSHPFTLYAIGRDAQEKGNRVVETILDAAQRMNLLSPKHQDNCTWAVHLCETEQKLQGALEVLLDMQCYIRMRAHLLFFFL